MLKTFSKIFIITIFLIFFLEGSARVFLKYQFDNSEIGLSEKKQYINYQPFVMYGENQYNFFKKIEKNFDKNLYNVLVIGGSTAELFPSNILQTSLTQITNKKIKIFNAAKGGYISSQEVIILVNSLNLKFDLIIFLNGANDILHSIRPGNKPGTFYLNSTYELFLNKPYLSPILYLIQNSQFIFSITRLAARKRSFSKNLFLEYCDVYLSNINKISKILNSLQTKYIVILQPHVAFKKIKHTNELNFTRYSYREKIVKELYKYIEEKLIINAKKNNYPFFSSVNIFDDNTKHIFSDDVHFIDKEGYKILSNEIIKRLKFFYF